MDDGRFDEIGNGRFCWFWHRISAATTSTSSRVACASIPFDCVTSTVPAFSRLYVAVCAGWGDISLSLDFVLLITASNLFFLEFSLFFLCGWPSSPHSIASLSLSFFAFALLHSPLIVTTEGTRDNSKSFDPKRPAPTIPPPHKSYHHEHREQRPSAICWQRCPWFYCWLC